MNGVTLVQPYNPEWPSWFDDIKAFLEPWLNDAAHTIEHVGSTAVPGMTAKPIIDIDIVITKPLFQSVKECLETIGYIHEGDLGIAEREAFALVNEPTNIILPPHHLYVCISGAGALRDHLCFRNFMRMHPEWVSKLSKHKVDLCKLYDNDRQSYIDGKSAMVREITALAVECLSG